MCTDQQLLISWNFWQNRRISPSILIVRVKDVPAIAREGWEESKSKGADLVIFDTAGRLQIDDELVNELELLKQRIEPHEILLVADSALGQEAVNVAKTFHERLGLTGIILTKIDGDARGGAALSMKKVTGTPIKFMGTGEKVEEFESFLPRSIGFADIGNGGCSIPR